MEDYLEETARAIDLAESPSELVGLSNEMDTLHSRIDFLKSYLANNVDSQNTKAYYALLDGLQVWSDEAMLLSQQASDYAHLYEAAERDMMEFGSEEAQIRATYYGGQL